MPCHDDLLSANFLHDGEHVRIVDWEYAGMGDRYFDLGNFAVNNELGRAGRGAAARPSTSASRPTSAGAPRSPCSATCRTSARRCGACVQTAVSDLDFDFEDYAGKHFARLASAAADPRFATRLEEARAGGP